MESSVQSHTADQRLKVNYRGTEWQSIKLNKVTISSALCIILFVFILYTVCMHLKAKLIKGWWWGRGWQYTYMSCTCTTQILWYEISCVMFRTDKRNIIHPACVIYSGFSSILHIKCVRKCEMSLMQKGNVKWTWNVSHISYLCPASYFWSSVKIMRFWTMVIWMAAYVIDYIDYTATS